MGRPFDRHLSSQELDALVPSFSETGQELRKLSADAVREAERHVLSCHDCRRKVRKYSQLINRLSLLTPAQSALAGSDCPNVAVWHEVMSGQIDGLKARELILHAALCDHCGILLRAATSSDDYVTPQEEKMLAELRIPSLQVLREERKGQPVAPNPFSGWRQFLRWKVLIPAVAMIVAVVGVILLSVPETVSASDFAEFAVSTHQQHTQGELTLDVVSDSQQTVNEWFRTALPFPLSLPASPALPGENRPCRLEGARALRIGGRSATYLAYQMQAGPAGLVVTPDSVVTASGGIEADFKKVRFHYAMVKGYRVVTWSQHGLTYALVSQEGNSTQRSCMVCHSAMRDRDLSNTPTPLLAAQNVVKRVVE